MLSLVVPGLIWPRQALADLAGDLPLPAFTRLLGGGRLSRTAPGNTAVTVAGALGQAAPTAVAALRRLAFGHPADDADWLCLDPARLRFEERSLVLDDPGQLTLDSAEAEALAVALAPTFAVLGTLQLLTPGSWNLRLATPAPHFADLQQFVGRAAPPLPGGSEYKAWRHALNEAQMELHSHPVNRAREAAGRPVVNTLWPWGGGRLPAAGGGGQAKLLADDPLFRGMALHQGIAASPLPERYADQPGGMQLAVYDALAAPARLGDALGWRDALVRLENAWLAPALDALRGGRLARLRLLAPGDHGGVALDVGRAALWRFWRKAQPLHACLAEASPP